MWYQSFEVVQGGGRHQALSSLPLNGPFGSSSSSLSTLGGSCLRDQDVALGDFHERSNKFHAKSSAR